jgi:hypothetical protein
MGWHIGSVTGVAGPLRVDPRQSETIQQNGEEDR